VAVEIAPALGAWTHLSTSVLSLGLVKSYRKCRGCIRDALLTYYHPRYLWSALSGADEVNWLATAGETQGVASYIAGTSHPCTRCSILAKAEASTPPATTLALSGRYGQGSLGCSAGPLLALSISGTH